VQFEDEYAPSPASGMCGLAHMGTFYGPLAVHLATVATCASTQTPAAIGHILESAERIESVVTLVSL